MRHLLQAILFVFASLVLAACGTTTATTPKSSQSGGIMTSKSGHKSGTLWTFKSYLPSPALGADYSKNNYIIVGGKNFLLNGLSGLVSPPVGALPSTLVDVIWTTGGQGGFVAVGTGYGAIYTSPDGITWSLAAGYSTNNYLYGITSGNNTLVAVGRDWNGYTNPVILTSIDNGTTWSPVAGYDGTVNMGYWPYGITCAGNKFIAVGGTASNVIDPGAGIILTSPDGITWTVAATGLNTSLYSAAWSGTTIVATGRRGNICTSLDGGLTWSQQFVGNSYLAKVKWTGTQFIAVGTAGTILTSTDGLNWIDRTIPGALNVNFEGLAVSPNQYIAVGSVVGSASGVVYTSP